MTKPTPDDLPSTFTELAELMRVRGKDLGDKLRPYEVTCGEVQWFVVSNSPGNACGAICGVRTVSKAEQLAAAIEAMGTRE